MKLITLDNLNHFKEKLEKLNATKEELIAIKETLKPSVFNLIYPVGVTYTQYPQQASPNELWGEFSTWKVVDYGGAFFRAEGGNANPFIEKTGVLTKQAELVGSHSDSVNVSGGNHRHSYNGSDDDRDRRYFGVDTEGNNLHCYGNVYYTDYSGDLSMSGTVIHNATENRPANFTIKIWKRTA